MRTSTEISKQERLHRTPEQKGNWMQLTIAPLVEQRMLVKETMPGTAKEKQSRKPR